MPDPSVSDLSPRDRIAEAALRRFVRFGARAVTMDDIAGDLHMSKKTLYEHFRDKEALLAHCVQCIISETQAQRRALLAEADNVIDGFVRVLRHVTVQMQQVNPLFFLDLEKHYPAVRAEVKRSRDDVYVRETAALLEQGIREGCFIEDVDVEVAVRLLFAQFDALSDPDLFPPNRFERGDLVRHVLVGFVRGIATPYGRRLVDELLSAPGT